MMEQESNELNSHLEVIENNINELEELKRSLEEIEKAEEKEILANLGKKIFIPLEIKEKELIIEIGNKIFVKKKIKPAIELIDSQLQKLNLGKEKVIEDLEELQIRVNDLMNEIDSKEKK